MDAGHSLVWAMFYQAVVAMQFHPGSKMRLSPEACAAYADEMLAEFKKRFGG